MGRAPAGPPRRHDRAPSVPRRPRAPPRRVPRLALLGAGARRRPAASLDRAPGLLLLHHRRALPRRHRRRFPRPDPRRPRGREWLALDYTDDATMRRRDAWDASSDVKHAHSYALHNPFFSGGAAVPLAPRAGRRHRPRRRDLRGPQGARAAPVGPGGRPRRRHRRQCRRTLGKVTRHGHGGTAVDITSFQQW